MPFHTSLMLPYLPLLLDIAFISCLESAFLTSQLCELIVWYFWAEEETGNKDYFCSIHQTLPLSIGLYTQTIHTNDFVNSVVVIEGHKAKPSLPCSTAFQHYVNAFDLSILFKIVTDLVLLSVFLDSTNKYLFHWQMGTWFVGVLWSNMSQWAHPEQVDDCRISNPTWDFTTSRDTALLGSTTRPSTLWGLAFMASSTSLKQE